MLKLQELYQIEQYSNSSGQAHNNIWLALRLCNLRGSIYIFAHAIVQLNRKIGAERLMLRGRRLIPTKLRTGLIDPLAHWRIRPRDITQLFHCIGKAHIDAFTRAVPCEFAPNKCGECAQCTVRIADIPLSNHTAKAFDFSRSTEIKRSEPKTPASVIAIFLPVALHHSGQYIRNFRK